MSKQEDVESVPAASFVALAAAAGFLDAIAFLRLGQVFVSNMTGNTVLMALALGDGQWRQVYQHAAALGGFAVGALVAARVRARRTRGVDPRWQRLVLLGVTAWLATTVAAWLIVGVADRTSLRLPLIAAFGAAMGAQATIAYLGARPRVPVSFDTGLIITLLGTAAGAAHDHHRRLHVWVIGALAGGALAGAVALRVSTVVAAGVLPLLVALAALAHHRHNRRGR